MSHLCTSSSTSGPVISKVAHRQVLSFLYPNELAQRSLARAKAPPRISILQRSVPSQAGLEAWFVTSLSNAAHCRKHRPSIQPTFFTSHTSEGPKLLRQVFGASFQRKQYTKSTVLEEAKVQLAPNTTREELLALQDEFLAEQQELDTETAATRKQLLEFIDPYSEPEYNKSLYYERPRRFQPADGPHLTVSDKNEDEWPAPYQEWPADEETKNTLNLLKKALGDLSNDPETSYNLYRALPEPRAPYLSARVRHRLLHHLAVVERKDEQSMLRYLSVVDDMKFTAIPLRLSEWNSAMSFAARYVKSSTELEVEAALSMWREMEHIAGVKGDAVTMNILFDVASKAGKFVLAEMIYKEMQTRALTFERFHHVGMIYFHGLKGDGEGVRAAFRALETAGDIIDTVVLNAMVSAFLHCHEASSAKAIYNFMKSKAQTNQHPPTDFMARRKYTQIFKIWAGYVQKDPSSRERFQAKTPMSPDIITYRAMLRYFSATVGDLQVVADLLDDLMALGIPMHGTHFLAIFEGFALHGGVRYTKWTIPLLERTWTTFLDALEKVPKEGPGSEDLYLSKWMVLFVLRAFAKCSGRSRTAEVWDEIQQRWDPGDEELDVVMQNLHTMLESKDVETGSDEWVLGALH